MGHTKAKVKIYGPRVPKPEELELLVDTGSTYTWIPGGMLKKLGIKPEKTRKFRTMTGRAVRREVGEAVLECLGEKATSMIVFGRKGDAAVLGVVSLETLGLEVDPITEQLKKSEALLAL